MAIAGLIVGGVGLALTIGFFVVQAIAGNRTNTNVLDTLRDSEADIIGQVVAVVGHVEWGQVITQAQEAVNNIEYHYTQIERFSDGEEERNKAKKWATDVLDDNNGIPKDLYTLHSIMMGENALGPVLMRVFADKLISAHLTQSPYHEASVFFRVMLSIQTKGLAVLANAYKVKDEDADIMECLRPYETSFKDQMDYNKQYMDTLKAWWANPAWGRAYIPISKTSRFHDTGYHYADTNANIAARGYVVVGMQLYPKGNRVGLKICQAPLLPSGDVASDSASWKGSPGWGDNFFNIVEQPYIDTNPTELPPGEVVTGVQLYLKNDRLAIKLQGTPLELATSDFDTASWATLGESGTWTPSPGQGGKSDAGNFANTNPVRPYPESYVTGACLYHYGNRIALRLKTDFFTFASET